MSPSPKRLKTVAKMSSDIHITVFSFLTRKQLNTVAHTHRKFHRIVDTHFKKFPLHCEQRVDVRVGIIDGKHGTIPSPAKVVANLKRGEFRARITHFHIGLMLRDQMDSANEFFRKYHSKDGGDSDNTTTIVEVFRDVEAFLPQLSSLWTDSVLHIHLHIGLIYDDIDPADSYLSAFDVDNDFAFADEGNFIAMFCEILFDDAHGQQFGAHFARCARLVVSEIDGREFYASFERLAAIHECANFELPGLLVCPLQLADFLAQSGVTENDSDALPSNPATTRNFVLSCYYIDVDELIGQMQSQLKHDFLASIRPRFAYTCRLSINANSDIEMPEAFAVENARTAETLRMWPDEGRSEAEREYEEVYFIQRIAGKL